MNKTRILFIMLSAICVLLWVKTTTAASYRYRLSIEKPVQHFIVKPDFTQVQTTVVISNLGDPMYVKISSSYPQDLKMSMAEMGSDPANSELKQVYLLAPQETKRFQVVISRNISSLGLKDYVTDVEIHQVLPQKPKYSQKSIIIEPVIHSYIILSSTTDGNMPVDPKIALFQNTGGPVVLSNKPSDIVLLMQNRSNYMFPIKGKMTLSSPDGKTQDIVIPQTYIFANSQRHLTQNGSEKTLLSIQPKDLAMGAYVARSELVIPGKNTPTLYGQTNFYVVNPIVVIFMLSILISVVAYMFYIGIHHT